MEHAGGGAARHWHRLPRLLLLLVGGRRDGRRQTDVDVVGVAA